MVFLTTEIVRMNYSIPILQPILQGGLPAAMT